MDPSMQYQQQSQPYDPPSSAAAYYPYHQYDNYQYYPQDYASYQQTPHDYSNYQQYPQDYSKYQQQPHQEESSSVHPPGVPIDSQPQYVAQDQYYPYQQQYDPSTWNGGGASTDAAYVAPRPAVASSYSDGGRRVGRGSSFRGRGRGRGRGGPSHKPIAAAPPQQPAPPPRMAWCELCRVDCTMPEILEKHLVGKKHKKNLKMREELERLDKILVERENKKVEAKEAGESGTDNTPSNISETGGSRGRGSKRKKKSGRGGGNKLIRTSEGSKTPIEPPKPKQPAVPFVCELCHVTCESQVVFDSHLKGKKHMGNVHYFQQQQTLLGQAALEALYPALQALLPSLQANYHSNPDGSSSSTLDPEPQQDGEDPQAILTQLLTSFLTSGQVGMIPGAPNISASGPPPVTENPNPEILTIQPEAGGQDAADVEAKSLLQPKLVNSDADLDAATEKKAETSTTESKTENVNAEPVSSQVDTGKKTDDLTTESATEMVDAQPPVKP